MAPKKHAESIVSGCACEAGTDFSIGSARNIVADTTAHERKG